ncbi:MAG TPA: CinA family nicotinamide mononucleotide deamidase-related protein [Anaerolineae bacterium]|nr:CinA family nicotinamide mononucleotide deamidase-related protein [Anaerolineae bacterium]
MQAEIIATGSELMLGEQVDTNSPYIARQLRAIGLPLVYTTHVGDDEPRLVEAIGIALSRSEAILIGGGLGPTVDDITRGAVARATGRALVFRPELFAQIEARFKAFGRKMSENNRQQAYVPEGAQPIENPVGTAPAFIVEHAGHVIVCLPGVSREMMYLLDQAVIPYLKAKLNLNEVIVVRTLHTVGEGESRLDALIADLEQSLNPVIGLSAKTGQVDVRLSARASSPAEAQALLVGLEAKVRKRIGALIFGADEETLESVIARLLVEHRQTLATVELNTGGLLSSRLTQRDAAGPAMSAVFQGGLVLSDANALRTTLEVDVEPVDAEFIGVVVRAAQRVRQTHAATLGLAALVQDAPDGTGMQMFAALVADEQTQTLERRFGGHPGLAAQWTSALALGMLWRNLKDTHAGA